MPRTSPFDLSTLTLAVAIRVLPSLAFPIIAGRLVKLYSHE